MIRSALLEALPGIRHAHTERRDGAVGGREVEGIAEVRARLSRDLGCAAGSLVAPSQVHGDRVLTVTDAGLPSPAPPADGLATATPGVALLVQGADCPLVALADPEAGVVAVVHSGWRGTAARIAAAGVRVAASLGARPADLRAAVFPGIGPCCFEVGPEVVAAFRETFGDAAPAWLVPGRGVRPHLDLTAAIVATLAGAGVPAGGIDVVRGCTACDGRFFSHRASGGAPGRHGLAIALSARP